VWSGGGPQSTNDSLNFDVDPYWKVPAAAQITSGPSLVLPIDLGVGNSSDHFGLQGWTNLWPTTPTVGDQYTVHVTYLDGSTEDLLLTVSGYITSAPTPTSPANLATGVALAPTFTWSAPAAPPAGAYTYNIGVYSNSGGNGWWYGSMPSSQTSVLYDVDGNASPTLAPNTQYSWQIEVQDVQGNRASQSVNFTTGP
jgi:hypothetical protein